MSHDEPDVKPSEQRGGATPGDAEAREGGEWAASAQEGVVPAALGGGDASPDMLDEDPELGSDVMGETTASDEPATDTGIDSSGGEHADAVTDGGAAAPPADGEPDLKDATAGPRASDRESAAG